MVTRGIGPSQTSPLVSERPNAAPCLQGMEEYRTGVTLKRYEGGSISRILFRIDRAYGGDHVSTAYVTISLQRPTREPRPGRPLPNVPPRTRRLPCKAKQAVRRVLLFGLAPGDAYPAIHVAADAVGSYPTISPLPLAIRGRSGAVYFLWRSCRIAPPGRYPAPCPVESGLSSHLESGKRPPDPRPHTREP